MNAREMKSEILAASDGLQVADTLARWMLATFDGKCDTCGAELEPMNPGKPDQPAEDGEHAGFDEKLHHDVAPARADCLADADFTRALRNGDEHDVHNANAANEQ